MCKEEDDEVEEDEEEVPMSTTSLTWQLTRHAEDVPKKTGESAKEVGAVCYLGLE